MENLIKAGMVNISLGIQPMTPQVGKIFYLDYIYGDPKSMAISRFNESPAFNWTLDQWKSFLDIRDFSSSYISAELLGYCIDGFIYYEAHKDNERLLTNQYKAELIYSKLPIIFYNPNINPEHIILGLFLNFITEILDNPVFRLLLLENDFIEKMNDKLFFEVLAKIELQLGVELFDKCREDHTWQFLNS